MGYQRKIFLWYPLELSPPTKFSLFQTNIVNRYSENVGWNRTRLLERGQCLETACLVRNCFEHNRTRCSQLLFFQNNQCHFCPILRRRTIVLRPFNSEECQHTYNIWIRQQTFLHIFPFGVGRQKKKYDQERDESTCNRKHHRISPEKKNTLSFGALPGEMYS